MMNNSLNKYFIFISFLSHLDKEAKDQLPVSTIGGIDNSPAQWHGSRWLDPLPWTI